MAILHDFLSPDGSPRPLVFTPRGEVFYEKDRPGDPKWEEEEWLRKFAAFTSLAGFLRYFWPVLHPGRKFIWNEHLDVVCYGLELLVYGHVEGNEIVLCIPPRSLKTETVSVAFPAWVWLRAPWAETLGLCSSDRVATGAAKDMRTVVQSDKYKALLAWAQENFPDYVEGGAWEISGDQNQKTKFENTAGGVRESLAAGATITGTGADILLIDDPIDAKTATEGAPDVIAAEMAQTIQRYGGTWGSRLNDPEKSVRVIIMQRLHELDLAGWGIDSMGMAHIVLPTEFNPNHPHLCEFDWRTEPGQLLFPERIGPKKVEEMKRQWAPEAYAAQHDQLPTPLGGGKFPLDGWHVYHEAPRAIWTSARRGGRIWTSWDVANKAGERNAYSVGYVGCRLLLHSRIYVLEEYRAKLEYPGLEATFDNVVSKWAPNVNVVEDAANGTTLIQVKRKQGKIKIHPISPHEHGGKEQRAAHTTRHLQDDTLSLPANAPWLGACKEEHAKFPRAMFKDRVDALAQLCLYVDVYDEAPVSDMNDGLRWLQNVGRDGRFNDIGLPRSKGRF